MFEERIREICLELGYEPVGFFPNSRGTGVASVRARSADGGMVVGRFVPAATAATAYSSFGGRRRWSAGEAPDQDRDVRALEEIRLRWSLGEMAGGRHLSPVSSFGRMGMYIYQIRPFYPLTLHDLIEKQMSPNHPVLFRVVDQLWAALAFFHREPVDLAHGAVDSHNVGFSSKWPSEADICLLDLKGMAESRQAESKRGDFQDLGKLIYRFVKSHVEPVDAVVAAVTCPNEIWSHLGEWEKEWKSLIIRLLDPGSFPAGYDFAAAREQLLAPLRSAGTAYTLVAGPHEVKGEPPYRGGNREQSATGPGADFRGEIERLLAAGDYPVALSTLLAVPDESVPRRQWVIWGNFIADHVSDEFSGDADFLAGMEVLAKRGAPRAGLWLGRIFSKSRSNDALPWLTAASEAGLTEGHLLLAEIYEHGGAGVDKDPVKSLRFYQASLDAHGGAEWDVSYAMASMILRETVLADRLSQAIRLLESCHAHGHYRSTDLLAQCHARGLGVESDERKAFSLFCESWDGSVSRGEDYHTASNNLGVCFAIGFGIRKDPARAEHYFKLGDSAGHEASRKNLHALVGGG